MEKQKQTPLKRILSVVLAGIILLAIVFLCMGGWQWISYAVRNQISTPGMDAEEAWEALGKAEVITVEYDLSKTQVSGLVEADGDFAGKLIGMDDRNVSFYVGEELLFRMEPYDGEPLYKDLEMDGGYVFYDGEDQLIGYAMNSYLELPSRKEDYVYLFCDGNLELSNYYVYPESRQLCSISGELWDQGSYQYNERNSICTARLVCKDEQEADVMHKLFFAVCIEQEVADGRKE